MTTRPKPHVHGRDHEHGGADPARIHWEDVGDAGSGGGIQFDTKPQAGDWLYIETTGVETGSGNKGIDLNAVDHDLSLTAGDDVTVFSGRDTVWSADRDVAVNADREIDLVANTDVLVRVNNGSAGGNLLLRNLPTSAPAVSGAVWNDGGTLKITP